jgi:hypothetical protein
MQVTLVASGPDWTAIMTAIGTVAVAIAAVAIAIWSDKRTGKRIKDERDHGDIVIAEERRLADKRLAEQFAQSADQLAEQRTAADKRLQDELAHTEMQLKEERQATQEQEQWAEAYAVSVTAARFDPEVYDPYIMAEPGELIACPAAIVVNGGRYTITRLRAWLCSGGSSITSYGHTEHFTAWWKLPEPLRGDVPVEGGDVPGEERNIWLPVEERDIWLDTLTPADLGMRYVGSAQVIRNLRGSYPIIHWRDRWGTYWEHQRGTVRQIKEGEEPSLL